MSRAKRYAALVMLRQTNTLLVHVHQSLHRLVHADGREGLTDSEKRLIMKRVQILQETQEDLSRLSERIFRQYNRRTKE